MTFQNIYYKRTAAMAKACYMCFRSTTTVLATLNTTDFLYTCDAHLTDRGFATLIEPPPEASAASESKVSGEEIRRIKEEWEERQKRAQEKEKAKAGDKDAASKDGDTKSKEPDTNKKSPTPKPPPLPPSPIPVPGSTAAAKPTHQRYILHRDVWAMRLAEHKKKRQTTAVKQVAPRLPMTPKGGVA